VTQLSSDKEMLTNKALQLSGKNAGSMLRIQELEDQIAMIEYGSMDRETTLQRVMEKEKNLQQALEIERQKQATLTAHVYFAKKSLKQMKKESMNSNSIGTRHPSGNLRGGSPTNQTNTNLRPSVIVPSQEQQSQARRNWAKLYNDVFGEVPDESVEATGAALFSHTLPEERELEMKMNR